MKNDLRYNVKGKSNGDTGPWLSADYLDSREDEAPLKLVGDPDFMESATILGEIKTRARSDLVKTKWDDLSQSEELQLQAYMILCQRHHTSCLCKE